MTFAVRGTGGLWGVAVLLVGLTACGSGSSKCGTNCKDGSADMKQQPVDAPLDHGQDTGTVEKHDAELDAPHDARMSVDLGPGCDQSITAACAAADGTHDAGAFSIHCASSWEATTSNAYFCGRPQTIVFTNVCGDYKELIDTNTNGSSEYIYIYDSSGALYAITYSAGGPTSHCVAGPEAGFTDPVGCDTSKLFSCPADAGRHG